MSSFQKVIKYCAIALAVALAVGIISGIVGAAALIVGFFESDGAAEDVRDVAVSGEVSSIVIVAGAADLRIEQGEAFSVRSNLKNLTVENESGTLRVIENHRVGVRYTDPVLTVYVPEGTRFARADITTGAGRFTVTSLSCDDLRLSLGAGEVAIDELNAYVNAEIEGGAGALRIYGGTLSDPSIDMGVGELELSTALRGHGEISQGIGRASVTLLGDREDYRVEFENGIGNATIDGKSAEGGKSYGSGANLLEINGGIGKIEINYK